MAADIIEVIGNKITPEVIKQICMILQNHGLVVAPTETRYGLLIRADRKETLKKLFELKKRPMTSPTAIFVKNKADLFEYGEQSDSASILAEKFLPGPLTMILKAKAPIEPEILKDGKIGLRLSSSPIIQSIMDGVNFPVSATSANRTGSPDHSTIVEIRAELGDEVDLYLDGGALTGKTSTVVDCSVNPPVVLREGAIASSLIYSHLKLGKYHG